MEEYELPVEQYGYDEDYDEKYADELEMMNELEDEGPNCNSRASSKLPSNQLKQDLDNPLLGMPFNGFKENSHLDMHKTDKRKRDFDPGIDLYLSDEDDNVATIEKEALPKKIKLSEEVPLLRKKAAKRVFSIPPFGKDVVTVTSTEGKRVFVCLCRDESCEKETVQGLSSRYSLHLLSKPFEVVKSNVEDRRRREALERAEALTMLLQTNDDDKMSEEDSDEPSHEAEDKLWVEKYTPRSFQELLSDDGTNRTLLKWIKLWDGVVFGKEMKGKNKKNGIKTEKESEGEKKIKGKRHWDPSEDLVLDGSGRPKFKIALLSGNPGLGKTTLAHVIGYHAGYNIVEMNASDDRSVDIFRNKIENATQMKAIIGDEKRPNCLIIDEIDGAPSPAINLLVQAAKDSQSGYLFPSLFSCKIKAGKEWKKCKENFDEFIGKGKKKSKLTITRPIICICNNQYVPALRQLRQNSLILNFPPTSSGRLVQRLLEISRKEQMRVDMATLFSLCDKSEHDIRSCINTLQFVRTKHKELKMEHLQTVDVGQKDMKCGLFDFIREVFQLPRSNKKALKFQKYSGENGMWRGQQGLQDDYHSAASSRFHHILHLAYSLSENERMIQGIHDNFPNSRAKDPRLESMVNGTEWLQFADTMDKMINNLQLFTLWRYYPFVPVAFHMMLSSPLAPKLTFQNSSIELQMKKSRTVQALASVVQDVSPSVRKNLSEGVAVMETLPHLFNVLTPGLRQVNIQLYSEYEKNELSNLIATMISYNLTYRQEKSLDGQYNYTLEPNIEEVLIYPGQPQHKHLTYASKQMIAREIELEKMRRIEAVEVSKQSKRDASSNANAKPKANTNNVVLSLEPVKLKKGQTKATRDFFGRIVQPKEPKVSSTGTDSKPGKEASLINTRIWFKFNEGFTNAVRRPVKVQDFL